MLSIGALTSPVGSYDVSGMENPGDTIVENKRTWTTDSSKSALITEGTVRRLSMKAMEAESRQDTQDQIE